MYIVPLTAIKHWKIKKKQYFPDYTFEVLDYDI